MSGPRRSTVERLFALVDRHGSDWMAKALCKDYPTPDYEHWWFPASYVREAPPEAKAICLRCPVRRECLAYGLELDRQPGADTTAVFGGYVGNERRRLFVNGVVPKGKLPR